MSAPRNRPRIVYGIVSTEANAIRQGFVPSRHRFLSVWKEAGRILDRKGLDVDAARKHVQDVDLLYGMKDPLEEEGA